MGLGQGKGWIREEALRLARIRLDIPNSADAAWKIDIRKSTARIPVTLRPWLTRLAEDTRERARKVFAYRGSPTAGPGSQPIQQAWVLERMATGIRYRIDENHAAVSAVIESAGELRPLVKAMLKVISETVPVQRIWLDTAENKDTPRTAFAGEPSAEVVEVLNTIFADLIGRRGLSSEAAKIQLGSIEPFQNYPNLIMNLGTHPANVAVEDK